MRVYGPTSLLSRICSHDGTTAGGSLSTRTRHPGQTPCNGRRVNFPPQGRLQQLHVLLLTPVSSHHLASGVLDKWVTSGFHFYCLCRWLVICSISQPTVTHGNRYVNKNKCLGSLERWWECSEKSSEGGLVYVRAARTLRLGGWGDAWPRIQTCTGPCFPPLSLGRWSRIWRRPFTSIILLSVWGHGVRLCSHIATELSRRSFSVYMLPVSVPLLSSPCQHPHCLLGEDEIFNRHWVLLRLSVN